MNLVVKLCTIAVFFIVPASVSATAQETKIVIAEGVASIQRGAKDIAREAAIDDARGRAVEQAIGILIDRATQVENYRVISKKILSHAKDYIKRYNIEGELVEDDLLRVRISAEVSLGRLNNDLKTEKMLTVYPSTATGGTKSVSITISGLNKEQFVKFKDALQNQVRGIKDMHEMSFSGNTARISVDAKEDAQSLADELVREDFGAFGVETVGSTANSLELKVAPK